MYTTVGDAVTDIRNKLDDLPSTGEGFWTDSMIISAIDEACSVISSRSLCLQSEIEYESVSGQYKYALPDDFLRAIAVFYNNTPLEYMGISNSHYRPTTTGTPYYYYLRFNSLCLSPAPSGNGDAIILEYYNISPHITSSTENVPLPSRFHYLIPLYAIGVLLPKDTMFNQAHMFIDMFSRRLAEEVAEYNVQTISPKRIERMTL